MISSHDREIQALVKDIEAGKLLLPELQRRYVWKSTQVRDLFDSLYRQYPSGQLLIWQTPDIPYSRQMSVDELDGGQRAPHLLLDGQQRLTSLAAVMLGNPLRVRDNTRPIDIAFNIYTEKFEVAGTRHYISNGWISLTRLFVQGEMVILSELKLDLSNPDMAPIFKRLQHIGNIRTYKYRVNLLEGLEYDEVTDIFVRINSGGTTLSSADLALAQLSSRWRGVTEALDSFEEKLRKNFIAVDTGILLRALAIFLAGQSRLGYLFRGERHTLGVEELSAAWGRVERGMEQALEFLVHTCKIDRLALLPTRYILIPLAAYFDRFGSNMTSAQARSLQRWVYLALIWSRYTGTTESAVDQDVAALASADPVAQLVQNVEDKVGRRPVTERELREQRKNSPFMLMAYVLARHHQAEDWFNGLTISNTPTQELHHIFPKPLLKKQGYDLRQASREVDQVANLVFLMGKSPTSAHRAPIDYLPTIESHRLHAQQVPLDKSLWQSEHFEAFTLARRTALADAINQLLASLTDRPVLWSTNTAEQLESRVDALERRLRELVAERLTECWGELAWERGVPKQIREQIDSRVKRDEAKNPFTRFPSLDAKLSQCQFSDYAKIIQQDRALFEDIFGKNEEPFLQHIRAITDIRNAFKHHKPIPASDLALGEAGLLWIEDVLRHWELISQEVDDRDAV